MLRLGGVLATDLSALPLSFDALYFESALPTDSRMHGVDVRDVASAFAAATTADVAREILLIAGDEHATTCARAKSRRRSLRRWAFRACCPPAGPATPRATPTGSSPTGWTPPAPRKRLGFQHHSWPDMVAELQAQAGWKRYPGRLIAPVARVILQRRSAYWKAPGQYADPWGAIRAKLGEPAPDKPYDRS